MAGTYDPLYNPEKDAHVVVPSLQQAIDRARKVLDELSKRLAKLNKASSNRPK